MQDCSNSIANTLDLLESCTKPSKLCYIFTITLTSHECLGIWSTTQLFIQPLIQNQLTKKKTLKHWPFVREHSTDHQWIFLVTKKLDFFSNSKFRIANSKENLKDWPFMRGIHQSSVDFPCHQWTPSHKGQYRGNVSRSWRHHGYFGSMTEPGFGVKWY